MSNVIATAVEILSSKIEGGFDGSVKFQIEGEGAIMVDSAGVRAGDEDAECTMSADAETFESVLNGELNPTAAFMSGKLSVDGDMGQAMKLGSLLS